MESLKFDERGLITVVAQDYRTGEVRMVAWANEEAVRKTLETGYAHYFSRSRGRIWKKGETSGELQRVREIRVDCDGDTLIYVVDQEKNRACHLGERNCFFRRIDGSRVEKPLPFETLQRLQEIIEKRLRERPEGSYTVRLADQGTDRVIQKFGEEAVETIIALKNESRKDIVHETADLIYTLTVALTLKGVKVEEVLEELSRRMK
ncbi:MAG: bifunctional phosphoribosyl-AMP cyclohydrolase/phosphoribosyl-ATP diphosphatase HisIE [Aquificota bacterium]|nr:bifunctional phosphoribosyl-AMP cyclohydrolase/phosphoribosyl-ATP diphosphatase HisIE [Aquificota bacterium]